MLGEEHTTTLEQVQESSDEQLHAWWSGFGVEENSGKHHEGASSSDWNLLLISELIYRGFCFQKENGRECADRGVSVSEMCPGCKSYWVKAAWLACRNTEAWIAECVI